MTDNTRALVDQLKAALEILAIGAHRRKLQEEAAYGTCFSATRVERARDEYKAVKDAIAAVDQWLQQPEQEPVAWLYRSITGIQRLHTEQGPMLKADMDAARDFPHAHSCVSLGLVHPLGQLPLGNGAGESVLANRGGNLTVKADDVSPDGHHDSGGTAGLAAAAVAGQVDRRVRHPVPKREMVLYHATTPKKVQHYHASGRIIAPVRGFTTLQAAMAWACKTGRSVVLQVQGEDCHKLPDHHNQFGEAWWVDHDVSAWKCVFSPKDA